MLLKIHLCLSENFYGERSYHSVFKDIIYANLYSVHLHFNPQECEFYVIDIFNHFRVQCVIAVSYILYITRECQWCVLFALSKKSGFNKHTHTHLLSGMHALYYICKIKLEMVGMRRERGLKSLIDLLRPIYAGVGF